MPQSSRKPNSKKRSTRTWYSPLFRSYSISHKPAHILAFLAFVGVVAWLAATHASDPYAKYLAPATSRTCAQWPCWCPDEYVTGPLQKDKMEQSMRCMTHPHLPLLPVGDNTTKGTQTYELYHSQQSLQTVFGTPMLDFASPFGETDASSMNIIRNLYDTHRGVDEGCNTKSNYNRYNLLVHSVNSDTTRAQVQGWVDQAYSSHCWLILLYHEIGASIGGGIYHVDTADFGADMAYIHSKGIAAVTVRQGVNEVTPQLP